MGGPLIVFGTLLYIKVKLFIYYANLYRLYISEKKLLLSRKTVLQITYRWTHAV